MDLLHEHKEIRNVYVLVIVSLSTTGTGSELTRVELGLLGLNLTLDRLVLLNENDLDVARGRHVRVDATVGTVGAATLAGSLVDLDVLDDKSLLLQALDLMIWVCRKTWSTHGQISCRGTTCRFSCELFASILVERAVVANVAFDGVSIKQYNTLWRS